MPTQVTETDIQTTELMKSFLGTLRPSRSSVEWVLDRISTGELSKPGQPYDAKTKAILAALWLRTLAEIGEERFDAAYQHVLMNSTFRPDIAEIRKAAGLGPDDEAMREFGAIIQAMRKHGAKLNPLSGAVMLDAGGAPIWDGQKQRREPGTPAPAFTDAAERAITLLGYGERAAGLVVLAEHPAISGEAGPFAVKLRTDIERRWADAYAQARRA